MPFALALAAVLIGLEQILALHFGLIGVVGFVLLTIGLKAKNVPCSCAGAVVLAVLLYQ
ncbi:hypothetical protein [Streptomyces sp. H27-D2]|uniref:hypothetical protein n=1 Tax=Streptomyces sp. H27-D2 TaxID=3046304 RepID=UPI002DB68911|nr:hypothetical protein [Streptomyces sp. H27-D2]MEC4015683.1 hypothetical protein [Streptomyces sp. H27-D2]